MISNYTSEGLRVQDSEDPAEHDAVKFLRDKYQSLFERRLHCVYAHDLDGNFLEANEAAFFTSRPPTSSSMKTSLRPMAYDRGNMLPYPYPTRVSAWTNR
jgi:hypothetical protein